MCDHANERGQDQERCPPLSLGTPTPSTTGRYIRTRLLRGASPSACDCWIPQQKVIWEQAKASGANWMDRNTINHSDCYRHGQCDSPKADWSRSWLSLQRNGRFRGLEINWDDTMSIKWLLFPLKVEWVYTYNFHFNYECRDEETLMLATTTSHCL